MNEHSFACRAAEEKTASPGNISKKSKDKASLILDAALILFAARGYDGVAVPEIAKAAGIATGTIYRHFADKQALANALYRRWRQTETELVLEPAPPNSAPRARFMRLWQRLTLFARTFPKAIQFLELHHHPWLDTENQDLTRRFYAGIAQMIEDGQRVAAIHPMPPAVAASLIWGAAAGLARFDAAAELKADAATADELGETLWRALATAKTASMGR